MCHHPTHGAVHQGRPSSPGQGLSLSPISLPWWHMNQKANKKAPVCLSSAFCFNNITVCGPPPHQHRSYGCTRAGVPAPVAPAPVTYAGDWLWLTSWQGAPLSVSLVFSPDTYDSIHPAQVLFSTQVFLAVFSR